MTTENTNQPISKLRSELLSNAERNYTFIVHAWLFDDAVMGEALETRKTAVQELVIQLCDKLDIPFMNCNDSQRKILSEMLLVWGAHLKVPDCIFRMGLQILIDNPAELNQALEKFSEAAALGHEAARVWGSQEDNSESKSSDSEN